MFDNRIILCAATALLSFYFLKFTTFKKLLPIVVNVHDFSPLL